MKAKAARTAFHQAKIVLFDFDGVLIDSNRLKTEGFIELAESLDPKFVPAIRKLLDQNPSATRFSVVDEILSLLGCHDIGLKQRLLEDYSRKTKSKIKGLAIDETFRALRRADHRDWGLVSATELQDLVELCQHLYVEDYFDLGIFGSPRPKEVNIRSAVGKKRAQMSEVIYLGDRMGDLRAARAAGTNFIFVKDWSDANEADSEQLEKQLTINRVGDLI